MEHNSKEVDALRSLVNDLYEQESQYLLSYPFRDLKEIMPYVEKDKDNFEFLKAFIIRSN